MHCTIYTLVKMPVKVRNESERLFSDPFRSIKDASEPMWSEISEKCWTFPNLVKNSFLFSMLWMAELRKSFVYDNFLNDLFLYLKNCKLVWSINFLSEIFKMKIILMCSLEERRFEWNTLIKAKINNL